jgi:hypothetical protein
VYLLSIKKVQADCLNLIFFKDDIFQKYLRCKIVTELVNFYFVKVSRNKQWCIFVVYFKYFQNCTLYNVYGRMNGEGLFDRDLGGRGLSQIEAKL